MRCRRVSLALGVVLLLTLGVLSFFYGARARHLLGLAYTGEEPENEPIVSSRPLSAWIADLQSERPMVRRQAAETLGESGSSFPKSPNIVQPLIRCLGDSEEFVRPAVVQSLGKIALWNREAQPPLYDAIKDQSNPLVRAKAAAALGGIRAESSVTVPVLTLALKDPEAIVRLEAASSLGLIRAERSTSVPALVSALQDVDPLVQAKAVNSLSRFGSEAKDAVEPLINLLHAPDREVRRGAAYALGAIGPMAKVAMPALRKSLNDEDKIVCDAASEALRRISSSE